MQGAYTGGSVDANVCKPVREPSPCEAAYSQLRSALDYQEGVLDNLMDRLTPVQRIPAPPAAAPQSGPTCVPEPSQSEVHAWLLAAIERTQAHSGRITGLIARLTV